MAVPGGCICFLTVQTFYGWTGHLHVMFKVEAAEERNAAHQITHPPTHPHNFDPTLEDSETSVLMC